jgi:predicted thioesterase
VPPEPGLSALVEITVTDADTAIAMRSGSVPVLATPRVIALVEEACVQAINGSLAPGQTSVGMQVQLGA